eukprot:5656881-Prymnesium_polylepis.3
MSVALRLEVDLHLTPQDPRASSVGTSHPCPIGQYGQAWQALRPGNEKVAVSRFPQVAMPEQVAWVHLWTLLVCTGRLQFLLGDRPA